MISVLSNVAPQMTHDICQLWFDGNHAESLRLQLQAMGLVRALFKESNPIPVKWAMNRLAGKPAASACRWWMPALPCSRCWKPN